MNTLLNRIRRVAEHMQWHDLMWLGTVLIAVVANAAAGTWIAVALLVICGALIIHAAYWEAECRAEMQSHDFTQQQLNEARVEIRRLNGDPVRWVDFGGQR